MKTFVATFAAILCAATVLFTVWSVADNAKKSSEREREYLRKLVDLRRAALAYQDFLRGAYEVQESDRQESVRLAQHCEYLLGETNTVEAKEEAKKFTIVWRDQLAHWSTVYPAWKTELSAELDRIDALAGSQ